MQFTPDLLPSDITGAEIYLQTEKGGQFQFQKGPIFANLVLADEINRAPAKVQSALLEAMEERQVTVAGKTYKMPDLFMVLATENPIEQEGTYPLPEAQLDRFLMHVVITYPDEATEGEIIKLNREENAQKPKDTARSRRRCRSRRSSTRAARSTAFSSPSSRRNTSSTSSTRRGFPAATASRWANGFRSARARAAASRSIAARACAPGSMAMTFVTPDHMRAVDARLPAAPADPELRGISQGVTADQVIDKITELVAPREELP